MVKEFKDYDVKYAKLKGKLLDYELEAGITKEHIAEKCEDVTVWPLKVNAYTNAAIREAVYFEASAEEWQQFRVSLKGFSTKEKLWRLYNRLIWFGLSDNKARYELEVLRVDNYLGALVRGGQLNTKHEVVR